MYNANIVRTEREAKRHENTHRYIYNRYNKREIHSLT